MWFLLSLAFADSPLTSTDLSVGYPDSQGVALAKKGMSAEVVAFLLGDHPLPERIAAADALGWKGSGNAAKLLSGIAEKRGKALDDLQLRDVLPGERVLLAYLLAHDDYFELSPLGAPGDDLRGATPLALATSGANALPDDFSAHAVVAIIDAHAKMKGSWCAVWTTWKGLLDRFPSKRRNLPAASVANVTDYLKLYEDDCGPTPGAPDSPELNQVYELIRWNGRLVAATQGGVVVWKDGKPESVREESLCSSVVAWEGAVYAGCQKRLLKYDGSWSTVSFDSGVREGGNFAVLLDGEGQLVVVSGDTELRVVDGALSGEGVRRPGYDRAWDADGTVWTIDFLSAVTHGDERYPLRSEAYGGSDPRQFHRDATGQLWVVDFGDGFFRWQAKEGRFVRYPFVSDKGSDVRVDPDRQRTWLLHYTKGPTLVDDGVAHALDLSELEYMRALHLDPDGTLWVAGWNGIARVEWHDGRFEVTKLAL